MKRMVVVACVVAVGVGAALIAPPEPPPEPLAGLIIDRPGIESPLDAAIWYCPWAQSDATRASFLAVASMAPSDADFTFPVSIPGEPQDEAHTTMQGPGASGIVLSDVALRGDSPGFVEFTGGPSAVTATVTGDVLTGDDWVARGAGEWFFPGGSTMTGEHLVLRLFNPFPEVAKVTVSGFSEIGVEALGDLRSVSVNPRSWKDISFEELLRQRLTLVLSVRSEEGLVVPVMTSGHVTGGDEAWWGGTGLSASWELPVAQADGTLASIVVANPGLSDVEVTIDLYAQDAAFPTAFAFTVPAESPVRVSLGDVGVTVLAARVSATAPVAAGVVATGAAGTGATAGAPAPARAWLLPGLRSRGTDIGTLWLLNTSDEPVSVTVGMLTESEVFNSRQIVEPGRLMLVPSTADAIGYLVSASEPFSAGWTIQGTTGIGFSSGIAGPADE